MVKKIKKVSTRSTTNALDKKYGQKYKEDIQRGVKFAAMVWDTTKSSEAEFKEFCLKHYVMPGRNRIGLLEKLDKFSGALNGYFQMMVKVARSGLDIADNPLTPGDELLGAFSASTHLSQDLRDFRIAVLAQLNFGTDETKPPRSRKDWAARRLSGLGREVIPAPLLAEAAKAEAEVDRFISSYNLNLDKIDFGDSRIKFPKGTRQITHWGLRDYMTGLSGQKDALIKQRAIRDLMRRVVDGEIPRQILENPEAVWDQKADTVNVNGAREKTRMTGALRWEKFKLAYDALRKIDPYTRYGNIIDNKFKLEREIPEEKIVKILKDILSSPVAKKAGKFIESKLGRPLEAHDLYFKEFQATGVKPKLRFDIANRYPNSAALTRAIPSILLKLGFSKERAKFIGSKIRVDNSRSAGHAWGPYAPEDIQLLRVRVDKGGITEQDFGVFMHELGHCVESVLSSYEVDYRALWGVPNIAFTEGFAFTFQDKADFILGRKTRENYNITNLKRYWEAYEIAGAALCEIEFFHWLYKNPRTTARAMHATIRKIGDAIWKKYYARIFGPEGFGLLAVYSHVLWSEFYLAEYPMGYVIAYQVRKYLRNKNLAREMERMCKLGSIYPEQWMKSAIGESISVRPLITDTEKAVNKLGH